MFRSLRQARVMVVGLGGLGSWIVAGLLHIGVGEIVGIDFDHIDVTNLNRQLLYRMQDVGRLKTEAVASYISESGLPTKFTSVNGKFTSEADVLERVRQVDLVFNPFGYSFPSDSDSPFWLISEVCVRTKTPCLHLGLGAVGPLCVPGETACMLCAMKSEAFVALLHKSTTLRYTHRIQPSFAPRIGIISLLACWESARFLAAIDVPPTLRAIIVRDTFDYANDCVINLTRDLRCGLCRT